MEPHGEEWPVQSRDFYDHLLNQQRTVAVPADLRERKLCVTWITRACSDYGFSPETGVLAVAFFDAFMAASRKEHSTELNFKQLMVKVGAVAVDTAGHKESQICELMCIVCIAVAAKKVEPKEKAPFLGDFDENFTFSELKKMETLVLDLLGWDLRAATVYDFLHYWVGHTLVPISHRKQLKEAANEAISYCIKENEFATQTASVFGAAVSLWAFAAQGLPTEGLEEEIRTHPALSDDDVKACCEYMSNALYTSYPQAYRATTAGRHSPSSIMDVANAFSSEPVVNKSGLKRPTPERPDRAPESGDASVDHALKKQRGEQHLQVAAAAETAVY